MKEIPYTEEWKRTRPDLVVHIPEAELGPETENQHFIVIPLANGHFFAVWTSAYYESHPNQHIVFSKSLDHGLNWTRPVTIVGPLAEPFNSPYEGDWEWPYFVPERTKRYLIENDHMTYKGMAGWAFPIYVAEMHRVWVFYNKSTGVIDSADTVSGELRGVYTDDEGESWSEEVTIPFRRWAIASPDPRVPVNWIVWHQPIEIQPGVVLAPGTNWPSKQLQEHDSEALNGNECWFWRFDNILTERDPAKLSVTLLPDGDHGIVVPDVDNPRRSVCSEPTVVALSNGRWFCVMRTRRGAIYYAVSDDEGHTWSETQPLRYRDGGEPMLQPVSCCPLYRLNDGRFLLTFHDNDGTDPSGRPPGKWSWQIYRTPAYLTVGEERLDSEQPIWFSRPKLFLDNGGKAWGPSERTEIGVYTSFFEFEDKRYYWYPDRKHFLLGKCIPDGFLADMEVPL